MFVNSNWFPFYSFILTESDEIIQLLVEGGADIDQKDNRGQTALHCAAENGNFILNMWMRPSRWIQSNQAVFFAKIDPISTFNVFFYPYTGRADLVKILLQNKADANAKDNNGDSSFAVTLKNRKFLQNPLDELSHGAIAKLTFYSFFPEQRAISIFARKKTCICSSLFVGNKLTKWIVQTFRAINSNQIVLT